MPLQSLETSFDLSTIAFALLAAFLMLFPLYSAWSMRRYRQRAPHLTPAQKSAERLSDYRQTIFFLWLTTVLIASLLFTGALDAESLWLVPNFHALAWMALAVSIVGSLLLVLQARTIAKSEEMKAQTLRQMDYVEPIMPRSRQELYWFYGVSFSAGFCEELLFRGFLLAALTPTLGLIGAMAVSTLLFGYAHIYQGGLMGFVRTGLLGAALMAIVYFAGSIWPAVLLHTVVDLVGGYIAYKCLREDEGGDPEPRLNGFEAHSY